MTVENPNQLPTATFTYLCSNLSCTFDGSDSADADGSISTYALDFDDGTTGSDATVEHSYSSGGTYTVVLTVTDNDGGQTSASQELNIDGPSGTMHVGDLDARKEIKGKSGRWEAFVTVTVHDANEAGVGGVTVHATWEGAATGAVSASTASDGTVTFSTGTLSGSDSVTFTITNLVGSLSYDATANHDPDNDSNGTTITVTKI
ncbi:hypothetical protein BH24ACT5_BH24ACT5_31050 [soil metagenome]